MGHVLQVLVATCVSCPLSIPRGISVPVQRECLFYLLVLVVVSMLGEMGWAQGGIFCDSAGNNIACIFVSITFIPISTLVMFCYQKTLLSWFFFPLC